MYRSRWILLQPRRTPVAKMSATTAKRSTSPTTKRSTSSASSSRTHHIAATAGKGLKAPLTPTVMSQLRKPQPLKRHSRGGEATSSKPKSASEPSLEQAPPPPPSPSSPQDAAIPSLPADELVGSVMNTPDCVSDAPPPITSSTDTAGVNNDEENSTSFPTLFWCAFDRRFFYGADAKKRILFLRAFGFDVVQPDKGDGNLFLTVSDPEVLTAKMKELDKAAREEAAASDALPPSSRNADSSSGNNTSSEHSPPTTEEELDVVGYATGKSSNLTAAEIRMTDAQREVAKVKRLLDKEVFIPLRRDVKAQQSKRSKLNVQMNELVARKKKLTEKKKAVDEAINAARLAPVPPPPQPPQLSSDKRRVGRPARQLTPEEVKRRAKAIESSIIIRKEATPKALQNVLGNVEQKLSDVEHSINNVSIRIAEVNADLSVSTVEKARGMTRRFLSARKRGFMAARARYYTHLKHRLGDEEHLTTPLSDGAGATEKESSDLPPQLLPPFEDVFASSIPLNAEQQTVHDLCCERGCHTYIGGDAGTGKSVVIRRVAHTLSIEKKLNVVVTASTGIAALNIDGITFHSQFGLDMRSDPTANPHLTLPDLIPRFDKSLLIMLDVIIIDEISMIHPMLWEALDLAARAAKLRNNPFGGIQIIASGDFMQLHSCEMGGGAKPSNTTALPFPTKTTTLSASDHATNANSSVQDRIEEGGEKMTLRQAMLIAQEAIDKHKKQAQPDAVISDKQKPPPPSPRSFASGSDSTPKKPQRDPIFANPLFKQTMVCVGLRQQMRQRHSDPSGDGKSSSSPQMMNNPRKNDKMFVNVLTNLRAGKVTKALLDTANNPEHESPIRLFPRRAEAMAHNTACLLALDTPEVVYRLRVETRRRNTKYHDITPAGKQQQSKVKNTSVDTNKKQTDEENESKVEVQQGGSKPTEKQPATSTTTPQQKQQEHHTPVSFDFTIAPLCGKGAGFIRSTIGSRLKALTKGVSASGSGASLAHIATKKAGGCYGRMMVSPGVPSVTLGMLRDVLTSMEAEGLITDVVAKQHDGAVISELRDRLAEDPVFSSRMLKEGSQVMLVRNLSRRFVNGLIGKIVGFAPFDPKLLPPLGGCGRPVSSLLPSAAPQIPAGVSLPPTMTTAPSGETATATTSSSSSIQTLYQTLFKNVYFGDAGNGTLIQFPIVQFEGDEDCYKRPVQIPYMGINLQHHRHLVVAFIMPLVPAYAFTVHKVQGLTLNHPVQFDCKKLWPCEHIVYTAASRVKKYEQLRLVNFDPSQVHVNPTAMSFANSLHPADMEMLERDVLTPTPQNDFTVPPLASWTRRV